VREGKKVIGMLTIQSYTPQAYDQKDLKTLEALADHCGGALERIAAQQALREAHDELEMRVEQRTAELSNANQLLKQQITERQRVEGALLKSELRLRLIWENSLDGMRLLDEEGAFVLVNPAYCKLVGRPQDLLIGKPLASVYDPSRCDEITSKHQERFRSGSFPASAETEVVLWNGKKIHLELSNSLLELSGERPLLLSTFRDITDRKRLEEQARQSQKMESIGQLAAGVAHDFNNLLTIIQGHTALLMGKEADSSTENAQSLSEISEATERAANLTRQLLAFSRKQIMQPKSMDLNEVIGNVAKMLRRVLGEQIDLQLNYASNLPPIRADTGMMEQIIINLALNARDAIETSGLLTIATTSVEIVAADLIHSAEARLGEFVCLRIADNGMGMDEVTLKRIFEPFFTTKEVGKGTGLGLATVYGIVKQHQGWIEVESQLDQGSTFKVFFPAQQLTPVKPIETAPRLKVNGGKETVLVVEAESSLRELTYQVLHRYGYCVLSAPSGIEALVLWEQHKEQIDLLLTDMMMPNGISGRELASRLLADRPKLKVLYTSGYSEELLGDAFGEDIHFLPKPYVPITLAQAVRDCLDNRRRDKNFPEVLI
jgi:two-component system cell cycle sensor histidine kinase/response regulator CckA